MEDTSFWYDSWSDQGSALSVLLGRRGIIDMGIRNDATVEDAILESRRRRRHRTPLLMSIENELNALTDSLNVEELDISLWKRESGFKHLFSTQETWKLLREQKDKCRWSRGVWFSQATPKFAFIMWLATLNRLSTMDRISSWNPGADSTCVLCKSASESRDHLFFECSYSSQIWEHTIRGVLRSSYTNRWSSIMLLITDGIRDKRKLFCIRYALQAVVYAVWRERNKVKHGDQLMSLSVLKKLVDKDILNKLSLLQTKRIGGMEGALQFWFATRV